MMLYSLSRSAVFAVLLMSVAACKPASSPDETLPAPAVPPTTPAAAAVETTVAVQSANPSLSPQGQPLEKPITCREEICDPASKRLVERCIAVSPATRPPCNVANPCQMIKDEIKRGCDFFGTDEKPAECSA